MVVLGKKLEMASLVTSSIKIMAVRHGDERAFQVWLGRRDAFRH